MKWNFTLPYARESTSLFHYPEVSRVTGKPVDWYHSEPTDGYEATRIYGEHTLELRNLPLGRTPEYMQERLRRFFAKFGPVRHCRCEPHPLDPYQCEGTAYVTFQDKGTALKALRAPLKFPASMHDKVISMRHLDSDKRNDPDHFEKSKFWNKELVSLARQLHVQLSADPELRADGKPLASVAIGLWERELVDLPYPHPSNHLGELVAPRGRGGVPVSKGLSGAPTRLVIPQAAVRRRFGSWEAFLSEPPFDELFRLEHRALPGAAAAQADGANHGGESASAEPGFVVVRPRLVSSVQRARILTRARMVLAKRLQEEFSVWWREGKVPLPEYTKRRVLWWDHKPHLPFEVQVQSRSKDLVRIFDERFLYRRQLVRARNERRKERREEYKEERKKLLVEKGQALQERKAKAFAAVDTARCRNLLGGLAPSASPSTRAA